MSKQRDYAFWVKLATRASVTVALTLVVVKLWAWLATDAASMLASATDSMLDGLAALFTFFSVRYALQPADREHRFGHGKAESLAALVQSALITGSALLLLVHSAQQLIEGTQVQRADLGVYVSLLAIVLTLGLVLIQRLAIRYTQSKAIAADQLHFQSDLLLNTAVIAALLLSAYGWYWADSLFAILIAVYLMWGAIRIGWEAFQALMDRELPDVDKEKIVEVLQGTDGIHGWHDLRTRASGPTRFIQCHVELEDELSLYAAHAIADGAEKRLRELFPDTDVIIHMDPLSVVAKSRESASDTRPESSAETPLPLADDNRHSQ
ncbi:cation diffusion facilitator family transporter [Pseudidiomarina insulisalsae]|uniref:Cation-efflux pump FieF n=1 Tax=Pseudidiomarina insulisalsae TaxID=575789 RepID=A0A432YQN3_9GAMM|nr:cation diffusion facilitator family transporter [Pseudidiomarina insulisalsae]RUO63685.1 divalent metal cation transporter FieF [Pseudidiomarina insulisalsae]